MVELELLGAINQPGRVQVDESITFKELLVEHGGGMVRQYPRPIVMQVGGPLGTIVKGERLNERVRDHVGEGTAAYMVSFFGERFCPVDFIRFLTRFLVRELRLDTDHVRSVNRSIEDIANGRTDIQGLERLRELAAVEENLTLAEHRLNVIADDLMNQFGDDFVEHAVAKHCHFSVCRGLFHGNAPCTNTCPSNMNVPGYIELLKTDRFQDAYTLMKQDNPLSFICGKVCPAPCESRCRQGDISGVSVAIRQLKRYIAEAAIHTTEYRDDRLPDKKKRVAIVGGGPAGISAAFYLAKTGYQVKIYEANARIGGMLAVGIPEHRLPYENIRQEFSFVEQMGVETALNTRIGEQIPLAALRGEFDAVLLATGRTIGRTMGPNCSQIESALNFLRDIKLGQRTSVPKQIAVIGGGSVAIDVAMSSLRLGAEPTVIVRGLMRAPQEEIDEAVEEGVNILSGWATRDFVFNNGNLEKLILHRSMQVLDDNARYAPVYKEDEVRELKTDLVVTAIGQEPDLAYLDDDIEVDDRHNIILNSALQTTAEGVFAAGEIKAPGLIISAVGEGKRAAVSIDYYLGGSGLYFGREIEVPETLINHEILEIPRQGPSRLAVGERRSNFAEVESTLTREQALCEADRCMRCDRNSIQELFLRHFPSA